METKKVHANLRFQAFQDEAQVAQVMEMIDKDLSEPYSIYTYRYFMYGWPHLCLSAYDIDNDEKLAGVILCKAYTTRRSRLRGYIAMLAVDKSFRRQGVGSTLVKMAIREMIRCGCDEAVLETEVTNRAAIRLYENMGFCRDKRMSKYYFSGGDAFRLKLWLKDVHAPNNHSFKSEDAPDSDVQDTTLQSTLSLDIQDSTERQLKNL